MNAEHFGSDGTADVHGSVSFIYLFIYLFVLFNFI